MNILKLNLTQIENSKKCSYKRRSHSRADRMHASEIQKK
jgi:hypothetical protein